LQYGHARGEDTAILPVAGRGSEFDAFGDDPTQFIGAGVPQDWAAHMIGMELTALFGIDHGQTLAILYPAMLEIRKEQKRAKFTIR